MKALLTQITFSECERAKLHVSQSDSGAVRIELFHDGDVIAMRFTTPADAWKFAKAVEAFAVKLMTPEVQG